MVDFRHFDLGTGSGGTPRFPHSGVCPTLLGLKMGEIWGFGRSRPHQSDLRDPLIRKEVSTRPQIGLDHFLDQFLCRGLVRAGDFWPIWGYVTVLSRDPQKSVREGRGAGFNKSVPFGDTIVACWSLLAETPGGTPRLWVLSGFSAIFGLNSEISANQVGRK